MARKATKKKGAAPDKAARAEIEQHIAGIQEFLKLEDIGRVDAGIELARSLDDPLIYEGLLEDCSIDDEGNLTGSGFFSDIQHSDYILLNLINYAPEDCNFDESLKRSNIESLDLDFNGLTHHVERGIPYDEEDEEIEDFVSLPDCLSNLPKLTSLGVWGGPLQNTDALANCVNLTSLNLNCCDSLKQVDFLPNLTNLTDLTLSFRQADCAEEIDDEEIWEIVGESSIENIDGLYNCSQLKRLTIVRADFKVDLSKLSKLSNLTHLSLDECDWIDADGLSNLTNLTSLYLSEFKTGDSLSSNKIAGGDSWTVETMLQTYSDGYPETVANLDELHALVIKFFE